MSRNSNALIDLFVNSEMNEEKQKIIDDIISYSLSKLEKIFPDVKTKEYKIHDDKKWKLDQRLAILLIIELFYLNNS